MSLHRDMTDCIGRGPADHRETFWQGVCDCGWEGQEFSTYGSSSAHDRARREYREHVEEVLGAEAYYDCNVSCRNCGSSHRQGVLVGTHVTSNACQRCGTNMLEPDNEAWDESRETSKHWRL